MASPKARRPCKRQEDVTSNTFNVVIVGAGFGGLELSARLSAAFGEGIKITLIDKNEAFVFGFSKFELMLGRQGREDVSLPYRTLHKPGVEFRQELVTSIDPVSRRAASRSFPRRDAMSASRVATSRSNRCRSGEWMACARSSASERTLSPWRKVSSASWRTWARVA